LGTTGFGLVVFSAQKANKDVALEVLQKFTRLDDSSLV